MIYINDTAKQMLDYNLSTDFKIRTKGYFKEHQHWIAFDNSSGDCFVEEFFKEKHAIAWVENYFDMSEFDDFKIFKVLKRLYYLPKQGFLKVSFENDKATTNLYRLRPL